jgi:hypothetical protein
MWPWVSTIPRNRPVFNDVIEIGQHEIDPVQIVFREHDPAIDDDHVAAVFKQGHVLADFTQAADRNNLQTFTHNSFVLLPCRSG